MINTTDDIRRILEALSNMCTDAHVRAILMKARSDIVQHITNGLPEANEDEKHFARTNQKIEAIKNYRLRTGASLRDAKDIIDQL